MTRLVLRHAFIVIVVTHTHTHLYSMQSLRGMNESSLVGKKKGEKDEDLHM